MKQYVFLIGGFFMIVWLLAACSNGNTYHNDYTIRDLKGGKWEEDTTYVYELPYAVGEKYFLIQGYDSKFSHKGELSLDFKMKVGTPNSCFA